MKEAREVFLSMKMKTFSDDLWRAIQNTDSGSGSLSIIRNCGITHAQQEFLKTHVDAIENEYRRSEYDVDYGTSPGIVEFSKLCPPFW